jgi:hypothetical protein
MKKTLSLIVAMTLCLYSYCQMKNMESESVTQELSSKDIADLGRLTTTKSDSLSLTELQQLNMQLRELNVQIADYRSDVALMSLRRQSSLIQAIVGPVTGTIGYVWLSNQRKYDNHIGPYVLITAGSVLCISSAITWICSYTPLAKSKVKVTSEGVVYRF